MDRRGGGRGGRGGGGRRGGRERREGEEGGREGYLFQSGQKVVYYWNLLVDLLPRSSITILRSRSG